MRTKLLLGVLAWFAACTLQAQEVNDRYIEVTGTSEIEIVPDKIHYLIEIREYFEEEFDGKSKSEEYRTKVPLGQIEQQLWTYKSTFRADRAAVVEGIDRCGDSERSGPYTRGGGLLAQTGTGFSGFQEIRHHIDRFQADR